MKRQLLVAGLLAAMAVPAAGGNRQERVWVQFAPGKGEAVKAQLERDGAKIHYRFDDLESFVVTLPGAAVARLRANPNVVLIEEDTRRYAMAQSTPYGITKIQATKVWDANADGVTDAGAPTGAGRMVCIIDSGIDLDHPDLQGLSVVGGYPGNYGVDNCGHGSHVAGTIAAVNNDIGVVGVSPGTVNLFIVKVFGEDSSTSCEWSYASTLVNAGKRCVAAGADVISMSLGGGRPNRNEERWFATTAANGILPVASAGNDGTTAYNYPASYPSVMSVAATNSSDVVADFSNKNDQVDVAAPGVDVYSTVPYAFKANMSVDGVAYAVSPMENSAIATVTGPLVDGGLCTAAGSWSGKVVLCQRGETTFAEKVAVATAGGGIAAIIYNNVSGSFSGTLGETPSTIPAVSTSMENGTVLLTQIGASAKVSVKKVLDTYAYYSGTSMAAPHVSGAAAVLLSSNPALTGADVRAALEATAKDLGTAGYDTSYGNGRIQVKSALNYLEAEAAAGAKHGK